MSGFQTAQRGPGSFGKWKNAKKSDAELVKILSLVNTMVECSRMSEPCNDYVLCFDLRLLKPGCFKKSIHNL